MSRDLVSLFVALVVFATIPLLTGCHQLVTGRDPAQGYMRSQSGEVVQVFRDLRGREYYYERGAKVYVNEAGGTRSPERPTRW